MIRILWDAGFKKSYRKKITPYDDRKERFWPAIEVFSRDPFHPRLRTHKLTGKLEGLWAFSVAYDCRVIFRFVNKTEILLIDIGSHDEVY